MIKEEVVHVKGYPKKLVIFLHGYIDSAESLDHKLLPLYENLDDFAIHLPQAPDICEIHERKRQWYSMHRFDPDDERKTVPDVQKCIAIYNKMALGLKETYDYLLPYIEQSVSEYGIDYKNVFLCGFSQGAMVALFTSLLMEEKLGGVISFSGILAGADYALKHARNHPDTLLIHGDTDNLVRGNTHRFSKEALTNAGTKVESYIIEHNNGRHMVTPDGLKHCVDFINRHCQS